MITETFEFFADGIRLDGVLWRPSDMPEDMELPTVVVCSGLHGFKEWVPARFAPAALELGYQCVGFDYRGAGSSDGPRSRILPDERVRDALACVTAVRARPDVEPESVVMLGWGLGAGIAVRAASEDLEIAAVCCVNGAGDYGRTARDAVPYPVWLDWLDRLEEDRARRALTGQSDMVDYRNITNPGYIEEFQANTRFFSEMEAHGEKPVPEVTLESCEAYLRFEPELVVGAVAPRPILILHGARNHVIPVDESHRLYDVADEPKTIHIVSDGAHLDMLDPDTDAYDETLAVVASWLAEALEDDVEPIGLDAMFDEEEFDAAALDGLLGGMDEDR